METIATFHLIHLTLGMSQRQVISESLQIVVLNEHETCHQKFKGRILHQGDHN